MMKHTTPTIGYTKTHAEWGLPFCLSNAINDQIKLDELEQAISQTKRYPLRMALITAIERQTNMRDFSVDWLRDAGGLPYFHDGIQPRHLCALGVVEV
jgi:hypothetical protein